MSDKVVCLDQSYAALNETEKQLLHRVREALPILADLSRSDLLLYSALNPDTLLILDQVQPHSIPSIYSHRNVGQTVPAIAVPSITRALCNAVPRSPWQPGLVNGVSMMRQILTVRNNTGRALAALSIETTLLAYERHRRRNRAFQQALRLLQDMVVRGELRGAASLSPFGEHDGILFVDAQRRIQYISGIATNIYRRLGFPWELLHTRIYRLDTVDAALFAEAINRQACIEREVEEHGRVLIRKAIPIFSPDQGPLRNRLRRFLSSPSAETIAGVLITVHDATEARRKEHELKVKTAMIQEIHHRVKNNLQTIASLLRMQSRRLLLPEARDAIEEGVNRILSVAVVHEFLSQREASAISVREIVQRIINQMEAGTLDPAKDIRFVLTGIDVLLPAQQATACALIVNELLQNAAEHGYRNRSGGVVTINIEDDGEFVTIAVQDDGGGLPEEFDLEHSTTLGLHIVQSLVHEDLRGTFCLTREGGTKATMTFPKTPLGGAKSWSDGE
ncbi:MAG: histidine kinase N-terminal domain-containing protein [Chloroflexi bacterium]|nr:histidine kinase N-terminal domain-containing protein [Chloroflexota bacterium]